MELPGVYIPCTTRRCPGWRGGGNRDGAQPWTNRSGGAPLVHAQLAEAIDRDGAREHRKRVQLPFVGVPVVHPVHSTW